MMTPERNARPRRQAHARRRFSVYQAGAPLVDNPRETVKRCIAMARRRADYLLRETLV